MSRTRPVDNILSEAEQIIRVWTENPSFATSDLNLAQFQTMIANLRARRSQTEDLRTQLTAAVNDTNSQAQAVSDVTARARERRDAPFSAPTPRNTNRPAAPAVASANDRPARPTTRFSFYAEGFSLSAYSRFTCEGGEAQREGFPYLASQARQLSA